MWPGSRERTIRLLGCERLDNSEDVKDPSHTVRRPHQLKTPCPQTTTETYWTASSTSRRHPLTITSSCRRHWGRPHRRRCRPVSPRGRGPASRSSPCCWTAWSPRRRRASVSTVAITASVRWGTSYDRAWGHTRWSCLPAVSHRATLLLLQQIDPQIHKQASELSVTAYTGPVMLD